MGKGEKLTGDEKALDQAVKEKKAAEENVLKLEMTGNNWKLQKEEMIKQENALAQAAGNEHNSYSSFCFRHVNWNWSIKCWQKPRKNMKMPLL